MNAIEFSGQSPAYVGVLGIKSLLKGFLSLSEGLSLALVCFYVGGKIVEFFLNERRLT